jgi:FkbM family methyltransferase
MRWRERLRRRFRRPAADAPESAAASLPAGDPPAHWRTRPGTWDEAMWSAVVRQNEYDVPARLEGGDVVIDVGAHIGCFSWMCLARGAGRVHAYEVEPHNFALLETNLAPAGERALARHAAVWRSDRDEELFFSPPQLDIDTGGGSVMDGRGAPVAHSVPFGAVLEEALAAGDSGRVRLLKLDCEGSEYPILYTAPTLEPIEEIVGEYHERPQDPRFAGLPGFTIAALAEFLAARGFEVQSAQTDPRGLGHFRATRARS